MTLRLTCCLFVLALTAGCAQAQRDSAAYRSRHTHCFQQTPEKAARCVARNAEQHSSALVSEVRVNAHGGAAVIVRVKNGVTYATVDIRPGATCSMGALVLNVRTSERSDNLINSLVKGC